ncbi:hypothetical protein BV25DRAFT_703360, partial [Artomyces pyxidatus]
MAQYAVEFLHAVDAAADAFGPLKSVVGGALYVAETVKKFKSNKNDWARFAAHIQDCVACVLLPENNQDLDDDRKEHVKVLASTLDDIKATINTIQDKKCWKRFRDFLKDPEKIADMRRRFDDTIRVFQLKHAIASERDVAEILEKLGPSTIEAIVQDLVEKFGDAIVRDIVVANVIHDAFPTPAGATWGPEKACSPGTRVAVLDEIEAWIDSADPTKRIFLISDVAGSGKSAIAHAICQRREEHLVSHFFFARGVSGRDDYGVLLGHIIRDLAALTPTLGREIGSIFERERSLVAAGPSRQFDKVIMPLSRLYPTNRPILIVLDALDEGYKNGDQVHLRLLEILRDQIDKLPGNFRILITCRPDDKIMPFLENKPHVLQLVAHLSGDAALYDVSVYVDQRLRQILASKSLPLAEDMASSRTLIEKSQGLFIWVATILNFLGTCQNPIQQLARLLAEGGPSPRSAKSKMDKLYQAILDDCNWDDDDFKEGYYLLMGTVLAARSPLTIAAMKALHKNAIAFDNMCQSSLRSLLSGLDANDKPVQILHLSLREFLTMQTSKQYAIIEQQHNQRLALFCVDALNSELSNNISDIGAITEHLLYACRFWSVHVVNMKQEDLSQKFLDTFSHFATNNLVTWMKVVTITDKFQPLDSVREWTQKMKLNERLISKISHEESVASTAFNIAIDLKNMALYNDALNAAQEATIIYKALADNQPVKFTPNLAMSLHNLSSCLSDVGRVSEALEAI